MSAALVFFAPLVNALDNNARAGLDLSVNAGNVFNIGSSPFATYIDENFEIDVRLNINKLLFNGLGEFDNTSTFASTGTVNLNISEYFDIEFYGGGEFGGASYKAFMSGARFSIFLNEAFTIFTGADYNLFSYKIDSFDIIGYSLDYEAGLELSLHDNISIVGSLSRSGFLFGSTWEGLDNDYALHEARAGFDLSMSSTMVSVGVSVGSDNTGYNKIGGDLSVQSEVGQFYDASFGVFFDRFYSEEPDRKSGASGKPQSSRRVNPLSLRGDFWVFSFIASFAYKFDFM